MYLCSHVPLNLMLHCQSCVGVDGAVGMTSAVGTVGSFPKRKWGTQTGKRLLVEDQLQDCNKDLECMYNIYILYLYTHILINT